MKIKILLTLALLFAGLIAFSLPVKAAENSDGVWSQSGTPGTTTITFVTTSGVAVGDNFVLTFPQEAPINGSGSNITMTGQTSPTRSNDVTFNQITITADSVVGGGSNISITMTDGLSSYNDSVFIEQSLAISHLNSSFVAKDIGLAIIHNRGTTVTATVEEEDSDGDGAGNHVEDDDRDDDGVPDQFDYDPFSWIYDEISGAIITGGSVEVIGPGDVELIHDGSEGFVQWSFDGTPGIYQIIFTPPPGWEVSDKCPANNDTFVPPTTSPNIYLGNDEYANTGVLSSNDCTTWYVSLSLDDDSPKIFLNNIPLKPAPSTFIGLLSDTGMNMFVVLFTSFMLIYASIKIKQVERRNRKKVDLQFEYAYDQDVISKIKKGKI